MLKHFNTKYTSILKNLIIKNDTFKQIQKIQILSYWTLIESLYLGLVSQKIKIRICRRQNIYL